MINNYFNTIVNCKHFGASSFNDFDTAIRLVRENSLIDEGLVPFYVEVKSRDYSELNLKGVGAFVKRQNVRRYLLNPGIEAIRKTFLEVIENELDGKSIDDHIDGFGIKVGCNTLSIEPRGYDDIWKNVSGHLIREENTKAFIDKKLNKFFDGILASRWPGSIQLCKVGSTAPGFRHVKKVLVDVACFTTELD